MILTGHHYHDRVEAGQVLARQLAHYASRVDTLVLAIPRDGVPIAIEVASYLNAPVDALVVQHLRTRGAEEVILGAIASGGIIVYDESAIQRARVSDKEIAEIAARESAELNRRELFYRGHRPPPQIPGRVVILVSDELAGLAMHAAVIALHRQQPAWLVVAAPVGSVEACEELAQEVHEVVCPVRPDSLPSSGTWYDNFAPSDDDQVRAALRRTSGLPRA